MWFKLIEAVEVSFVSSGRGSDKPENEVNQLASFLAVTYEHWAKIIQKYELLALLAP